MQRTEIRQRRSLCSQDVVLRLTMKPTSSPKMLATLFKVSTFGMLGKLRLREATEFAYQLHDLWDAESPGGNPLT